MCIISTRKKVTVVVSKEIRNPKMSAFKSDFHYVSKVRRLHVSSLMNLYVLFAFFVVKVFSNS